MEKSSKFKLHMKGILYIMPAVVLLIIVMWNPLGRSSNKRMYENIDTYNFKLIEKNFYSVDEAMAYFTGKDLEEMNYYKFFNYTDFVFVLVYGWLLYVSFMFLLVKSKAFRNNKIPVWLLKGIILLPVLADLVENTAVYNLLRLSEEANWTLLWIVTIASAVKFTGLIILGIGALFLLVEVHYRAAKRDKKPANCKDKQYTLWTMNRASSLLDPFIEKYIDEFKESNIIMGNRQETLDKIIKDYGNFGENAMELRRNTFKRRDFSHSLMYEEGLPEDKKLGESECNEYWVPIVIKTIGDFHKRWKNNPYITVDNCDTKLLKKIIDYDKKKYDDDPTRGDADYETYMQKYWETGVGLDCDNRICTPFVSAEAEKAFIGLYEILIQNDNNILVGYSQGGLVARYLAFLDEKVFKLNKISAVITLQSVNYGSTQGSGKEGENIAKELVEAISDGVADLIPDKSGQITVVPFAKKRCKESGPDYAKSQHNAESIHDLLMACYKFFSKLKCFEATAEIFDAALKWTSGLRSELSGKGKLPDTAFEDMEPSSLDKQYSVLNSVNRYESELERCKTYAVVGTKHNMNYSMRGITQWLLLIIVAIIVFLMRIEADLWGFSVFLIGRFVEGLPDSVSLGIQGIVERILRLIVASVGIGIFIFALHKAWKLIKRWYKAFANTSERYTKMMTSYNNMWPFICNKAGRKWDPKWDEKSEKKSDGKSNCNCTRKRKCWGVYIRKACRKGKPRVEAGMWSKGEATKEEATPKEAIKVTKCEEKPKGLDSRSYYKAIRESGIIEADHDYVIPSAAEFILSRQTVTEDNKIKNHFINRHASHISGAKLNHKAANRTTKFVFEALEEITCSKHGLSNLSKFHGFIIKKYKKRKKRARKRRTKDMKGNK